jgi:hypothetical protein
VRTHIILWKWDQENIPTERSYDWRHVNAMNGMLLRNIAGVRAPVRVLCVTDSPGGIHCETYPLWNDCFNVPNATKKTLPSCYRRLKLYDYETQRNMGIEKGDRIVSIDLDTVVTGNLKQVLETEGRFVGWKLFGTYHPEVYNGSFQMFTAGDLQHIWSEFNPVVSPMETNDKGWQGSDQAWLSWKLIDKEGSTYIDYPILASYPLHCCQMGAFSAKHRLIFFHGRIKPWSPEALARTKWIERYWRE